MPHQLTLQIHHNNAWHDAAELTFSDDYRPIRLDYLFDYAINFLERDDNVAVSLNYPVQIFSDSTLKKFTFLDDIVPSGASRRYWVQHLDIRRLPEFEQDFRLLQHATIAPIGNMRVKQAVPPAAPIHLFSADEVINRQPHFLEYAQANGAMTGGATGAGGEAPKLLLRQTKNGEIWIDNQQDDLSDDAYFLIKYPRNQRTEIDCDILRAEFHYYHEINDLGFETMDVAAMKLHEGERYPSLWLPRFDVRHEQGKTTRYAMQSLYSLLEKGAGAALNHGQVIREVVEKIGQSHTVGQGAAFDAQQWILTYLQRDILNIAFGNSDNHGRNMSILRDSGSLKWSPIYDFAPMRADPEMIIRSSTWGAPLEIGGEYDFVAIAQSLGDVVDSDWLLHELRATASQLVDLPTRLQQRGVPSSILTMPIFGFDRLPEKFAKWGLLP